MQGSRQPDLAAQGRPSGPVAASRIHRWVAIGLLCSLSGCGEDPLTASVAGARPQAGFVEHSATLSDGRTMRFTSWMKFVPEQTRFPLVLVLHGGGQIYPWVGRNYLESIAQPALADLRATFIAPDLQSATWSDPYTKDAVIALLDAVLAAWPVDPDRVIVTGYSAGGLGTWAYTEEFPERFRAGIPIAADVITGKATGAGRVPMFVIHGTGDAVFSYDDVVRDVEAMRQSGADVMLHTVEGASHAALSSYKDPLSGAVPWIRERW